MSKSPNILLPALGVTGIVLGAAYGISQRGYGADKIATLEARVSQVESSASAAAAKAADASAAAEAETARATDLEAQIAVIQAEALKKVASGAATLTTPAPVMEGTYGLGRTALPQEIAAWDVDVLPDGRGLPEGSGDVWTGEEVFADACAACHGDFAEGVDNWPVLAGGFDTLADEDPVKTVGSYWPYLSTVFDYVHRSMPFGAAGTLSADETYAIVAYILYSNDMVDDDFVLSNETFMDVQMHNADGFVIDDRPDLEYADWRAEPCMENCKDEVQVTMRSVFLVETPPEGGSDSVMNHNRDQELPSFTAEGATFVPAPTPAPEAAEVEEASASTEETAPVVTAAVGTDLFDAGEKVFKKCASCHQIGDGAKHRSGPLLTGVMDRTIGVADGFKYSGVFQDAAAAGRTWSDEEMAAFMKAPKEHMKGTKMSFRGLKADEDIAALIAYLRSFDG